MRSIKFPKYFLLKDKYINRNISFLRKLIKINDKQYAINFSELQETSRGCIMVFMAQIEKSIASFGKKIYRSGKLPSSKLIKNMLLTLDDTVHENMLLTPTILSDNEMRANLVNPKLIDSIVGELKKIGIKEYYSPFNTF